MTKLIILVVSLGLLVGATQAIGHDAPRGISPKVRVAHYYIESYSEEVWWNRFYGHCGNGTTWWCNWRHYPDCSMTTGIHSRRCVFNFNEQTVFSGRSCTIQGRIEHGTIASWDEWCW